MVRLQCLTILFLIVLTSCKGGGGDTVSSDSTVKIETKGIQEPVSIYVNDEKISSSYNAGEYVKGSESYIFEIKIKNNSKFEIFDINLSFEDINIPNYNFTINETTGLREFPGKNGTCSRKLAKSSSCLIEVEFSAVTSGVIGQDFIISYRNLLEKIQKTIGFATTSGVPASLLFEPNINSYTFGNPTGKSEKPLLEREYRVTEVKNLLIINKGELTARNVDVQFIQNCSSYPTGVCPFGQNAAYKLLSHNCPQTMGPGDSCNASVSVTNTNQGTDPLLKEITFTAGLKLNYAKDPQGTQSALNGNFTVTSTNIEARFETSVSSIGFETPLTVGNREERLFRIKNTGYRSGILRKIWIYPAGVGTPDFYCQKGGADLLDCYHVSDDSAVSLDDWHFKIQDKENCMNSSMNQLVEDTSGCLFGLIYQPSVEKLVGGTDQWEFRIEFDSLFLGQENIQINSAVDIYVEGSYKSAAQISVSDYSVPYYIDYNELTDEVAPEDDPSGNQMLGANLRRVSLMLPAYAETAQMSVTFKNDGETEAKNIQISDGLLQAFSMDSIIGHLGTYNPSAYQDVTVPKTSCEVILPGDTCTISWNFAPIARADDQQTHEGLFDQIYGIKDPNNYKEIRFRYDDGSLYTDDNLQTTTEDVEEKLTGFKYYMIPVTSGNLGKFKYACDGCFGTTPNALDVASMVRGNTKTLSFIMRNIGTGSIPYMLGGGRFYCDSAAGCPVNRSVGNYELVATPAPLLTEYSATDCLDHINFENHLENFDAIFSRSDAYSVQQGGGDYTPPGYPGSITRSAVTPLASGASCIITAEYEIKNHFFPKQDLAGPPLDLRAYEVNRAWHSSFTDEQLHNLAIYGSETYSVSFPLGLTYFNGDVGQVGNMTYILPSSASADETAQPMHSIYGYFLSRVDSTLGVAKNYNYQDDEAPEVPAVAMTIRDWPVPIPLSGIPISSSVISRPSFTRNEILKDDGSQITSWDPISSSWVVRNPTTLIKELWYYDLGSAFAVYDNTLVTNEKDPNDLFPLSYAYLGFEDVKAVRPICVDCDYFLDIGAFPEDKTINFSFFIANVSGQSQIRNASFNDPNSVFTLDDYSANLNTALGSGGLLFTGTFDPSSAGPGVYSATFTYSVTDGRVVDLVTPSNDSTITYKLIITAEAVADAPSLVLTKMRYDVTTAEGVPVSETLITDPATFVTMEYHINNDAISQPVDDSFVEETMIVLEMVKAEAIDETSGYAKKRIEVKNRSTSKTLEGLTYYFRGGPTDRVNILTSVMPGLTFTSDCTETLAPEASCYIDFKYQPMMMATNYNAYFTIAHKSKGERYIQQNLLFKLRPLDPSKLSIVGYPVGVVEISAGGSTDQNAHELDFGTFTLDTPTKVQSFAFEIENDSTTLRASLLKAWEEHTSSTGWPNTWENIGGLDYTVIYDDGKIVMKASRECFVGEDPAGLQDYEKGFLSAITPCMAIVDLTLDINDVGIRIDTSFETVENFYVRIPYYSFQRINVGYLSFYFQGKTRPDGYTQVSGFYGVSGKETKVINYSYPQVQADNVAVGSIAGYRIYYSTSGANLTSSVLTNSSGYIADIWETADDVDVVFNSAILPTIAKGTFYYFKVVAIRANASYTRGYFPNLPAGYYLSEGDLPILRIMVPNTGFSYIHNQNVMVQKNLELAEPMTYSSAVSLCASRTIFYTDQGVTKGKQQLVITQSIWSSVKNNSNHSNAYSVGNILEVPHWIGPLSFDIETEFTGHPDYNPTETFGCFSSTKNCFLKCDSDCTTDRMVAGGFFGAGETIVDYISYAAQDYPVGYPRCYINVAP